MANMRSCPGSRRSKDRAAGRSNRRRPPDCAGGSGVPFLKGATVSKKKAKACVLKPFRDARQIWKGLETEGSRRKLFHLVYVDLHDSKHLVAGLAMFEPGEGA